MGEKEEEEEKECKHIYLSSIVLVRTSKDAHFASLFLRWHISNGAARTETASGQETND